MQNFAAKKRTKKLPHETKSVKLDYENGRHAIDFQTENIMQCNSFMTMLERYQS